MLSHLNHGHHRFITPPLISPPVYRHSPAVGSPPPKFTQYGQISLWRLKCSNQQTSKCRSLPPPPLPVESIQDHVIHSNPFARLRTPHESIARTAEYDPRPFVLGSHLGERETRGYIKTKLTTRIRSGDFGLSLSVAHCCLVYYKHSSPHT